LDCAVEIPWKRFQSQTSELQSKQSLSKENGAISTPKVFDYEFPGKPGTVQQTKPGVCFPMMATGGAVVALADGGKRQKQHTIQIKGQ